MKKINLTYLFLIFSLIFFLYIFLKSFNNGEILKYYYKYYFLSLIFFILSISTFFISKKNKENLAVIIFSVLFTFYIIEIFLIFLVSNYATKNFINYKPNLKEHYSTYKKLTGKNFDKRTPFEIYTDMKKENPGVVMSTFPALFLKESKLDKNNNNFNSTDIIPLSGISNSQTINCNENGYYSIFQSDRYGFNNDDNQWDKDYFEYILIGDSFAYGSCVNREENIAGNLSKIIGNEKGVLNLGYGSIGPLIEYAILKEYFPKRSKKKNLLWFYYEKNDLNNLKNESENEVLSKYLKDKSFSQNLKENDDIKNIILKNFTNLKYLQKYYEEKILTEEEQKNLDNYIQIREKEIQILRNELNYNLFTFLKLKYFRLNTIDFYSNSDKRKGVNWSNLDRFFRSFFKLNQNTQIKEITKLKEILINTKEIVKEHNMDLYFVYLPSNERFVLANNNNNYRHYNRIISLIDELDIKIIDVNKKIFSKKDDPLSFFPFRHYTHYTAEMYKLITQLIIKETK